MGILGAFSSSSKTKNTQNTTNTSITQDMSDNSVNNIDSSTRLELSGQYAGVNTAGGAFNVTDGGAFNLVADAMGGVIGLTRDTVGVMAGLADSGFALADSVTGRGLDLADSLTARNANLAESLAAYNAQVARDSMQNSTAISAALLDYAAGESEQAKNLSENTTRYALQAVDSISRSDGQQLGIESLKTQKMIFIGLGGLALLAVLMRAK